MSDLQRMCINGHCSEVPIIDIVNSGTVTQAGEKAIDAIQLNPSISGTLANRIKYIEDGLWTEVSTIEELDLLATAYDGKAFVFLAKDNVAQLLSRTGSSPSPETSFVCIGIKKGTDLFFNSVTGRRQSSGVISLTTQDIILSHYNYLGGDVFNGSLYVYGDITRDGKRLDIYIPVNHGTQYILDQWANSATRFNLRLRSINGILVSDNFDVLADQNIESVTFGKGLNVLWIEVVKSNGWGVQNNTPVNGAITLTAEMRGD